MDCKYTTPAKDGYHRYGTKIPCHWCGKPHHRRYDRWKYSLFCSESCKDAYNAELKSKNPFDVDSQWTDDSDELPF